MRGLRIHRIYQSLIIDPFGSPPLDRRCGAADLAQYRWSSYRYLQQAKDRPRFLNLTTCLSGAGGLEDTAEGRRKYAHYLEWLSANEPAQRELAFAQMSRGWVIGGDRFKRDLAQDEAVERLVVRQSQAEAREVRKERWAAALEKGMSQLRKTERDVRDDPKSADWKVALAGVLKKQMLSTNRWLGEQLNMGPPAAVCRYVSEALTGQRPAALQIMAKLNH